MKSVLLVALALVAAFAAITWWALESGGVAVIETRAPNGSVRATHVWYTEHDGELWLEAGTPENAWFQDVQQNPLVTFSADGNSLRYRARPFTGASGHSQIRALLRDKYGLRDRWVGLIADTSLSIAVQLLPAEE